MSVATMQSTMAVLGALALCARVASAGCAALQGAVLSRARKRCMSWEVPTRPRSEHVAQDTASTPHARAESGRRAAQGSAGIELNQCGTDIGFCTFSRGRGDKGAAIYMQARPPHAQRAPASGGARADRGVARAAGAELQPGVLLCARRAFAGQRRPPVRVPRCCGLTAAEGRMVAALGAAGPGALAPTPAARRAGHDGQRARLRVRPEHGLQRRRRVPRLQQRQPGRQRLPQQHRAPVRRRRVRFACAGAPRAPGPAAPARLPALMRSRGQAPPQRPLACCPLPSLAGRRADGFFVGAPDTGRKRRRATSRATRLPATPARARGARRCSVPCRRGPSAPSRAWTATRMCAPRAARPHGAGSQGRAEPHDAPQVLLTRASL